MSNPVRSFGNCAFDCTPRSFSTRSYLGRLRIQRLETENNWLWLWGNDIGGFKEFQVPEELLKGGKPGLTFDPRQTKLISVGDCEAHIGNQSQTLDATPCSTVVRCLCPDGDTY